ncbi:MAG: potassium/proton antiporter [Dermatophilaceae bacterium]|nr:potassium/proton antiporter [Actinomycetales bacterium]
MAPLTVPTIVAPAIEGFDVTDLTVAMLLGTLVLLLALISVRISDRSGLPVMLLYLGIGLAFGVDGLGITFNDASLTQVLGYAALVLILADGGLTTSWPGIRRSVAPALALSTVGVVVSIVVVAAGARFIFGWSWQLSLLLGAILASTDAAAVFSVLRNVALPRRVRGMLEAESGFNDAPVVIITTALALQLTTGAEETSWLELLALALLELTAGAVIGLLIGWIAGRLVRQIASGTSGLFAIAVLAIPILAYAAASAAHTSGFIAAYLGALVLGNMDLPHVNAVHAFASAVGTLAQIGLFFLLGLLASPIRLSSQVVPALVLGFVLLVVARPLSVAVSLAPFRIPWRDQIFLSWAGLRGAVPVVLATVPVTLGAAGTTWIFDFVFVLVLIYTLVQGPTLPWLAERLGLVESVQPVPLSVETTVLDRMNAEIVTAQIGPRSKLHGVEVFELRLPRDANITLVVRNGHTFVPDGVSRLRHGDEILIVTPAPLRHEVEKRLVMVSRYGRLAGWVVESPPRLGRRARARRRAGQLWRRAQAAARPRS